MPFRPQKKQPQFADLKGILSQSKQTDNALYQTVQILIERLIQLQGNYNEALGIVDPDNPKAEIASKQATYITRLNELGVLPRSSQLIAGVGITLDSTVFGKLTISSSGGSGSGGYAPMSTGAEPLEIMSNGAGQVLMVGFSE